MPCGASTASTHGASARCRRLLGSPYPLPEARLIYEIGRRGECTASELGARPGSRPGLSQPPAAGPAAPRPGAGRAARRTTRAASVLSLTAKGRKAFGMLDARSRDEVGGHARQAAGARAGAAGRRDADRRVAAGRRRADDARSTLRAHRARRHGLGGAGATGGSTPRSAAGTSASRRWSPRSRRFHR